MVLLRERVARRGIGAIEPCLPSPAKQPPSGLGWIYEIKHDGFRLIARRDGKRVRLIARKGNDFTGRFPFIATAVVELPARSCVIDGEAMACDENGLVVFELIRRRRTSDRRCALRFRFPRTRRRRSAAAADRAPSRAFG